MTTPENNKKIAETLEKALADGNKAIAQANKALDDLIAKLNAILEENE
jgi:uncharacterized coiled-coil protein SlyX